MTLGHGGRSRPLIWSRCHDKRLARRQELGLHLRPRRQSGGEPPRLNALDKHGARQAGSEADRRRPALDPHRRHADVYAPIRSGTDIVLLGALMNYTIQNKLYNEEYVKYYTNALTLINPDYKGPGDLDGYALDDVKDSTGKVLLEKGKPLSAFATIASAADPGTIACGCWILGGYFADADDGNDNKMPAVKRRGQKDPGDMGFYPYWGFTWPANRRILYNRASAKPDGTPWSEDKKVIWWDATADSGTKDASGNPILGKWVGYDVPDYAPTKKPEAKADPTKTGLATQAGTDPFIMRPDGKGGLFAPSGTAAADGPMPEHYEPLESPVTNPMSSTQNDPAIKIWQTRTPIRRSATPWVRRKSTPSLAQRIGLPSNGRPAR